MKPPPTLSVPLPENAVLAPRRSWRGFVIALVGLVAAFGWHLVALTQYSLQSDLYSHIVLIPAVSGYFIWLRREHLPAPGRTDWVIGLVAGLCAAGLIALDRTLAASGSASLEDTLAIRSTAFVAGAFAVCGWFLGRELTRSILFPLGFLAFMIPLPTAVEHQVEFFFQHGSAPVAAAFLQFAGMPVYRDELVLMLPGFSMQVAPQCSGIHSSLALFITSVAAGQLFLHRTGSRLVLALAVIPLALLRNGFRIFVIGELCVQIGPEMIDSFIHRQGGPIFFALSMVPFTLLLFVLYRLDRRFASRRTA